MKDHLNPGGVVTLFVQLYESGMPGVKSEMATFIRRSRTAWCWATPTTAGYDLVLVGQNGPMKIDVDAIEASSPARSMRRSRSRCTRSASTTRPTVRDVRGQRADLRPWLADAQINRDRNLRLQFLAGLGVNGNVAPEIHQEMLLYRTFPDHLFTGSPASLATLRTKMLGGP